MVAAPASARLRISATRRASGDRTQHRFGARGAPRTRMRPEQQIRNPVSARGGNRNVAGAVGMAFQCRRPDHRERNVQRHGERDAELHDDPPRGDDVAGGSGRQPRQQCEDTARQTAGDDHPQGRERCGHDGLAVHQSRCDPPDREQGEVDRHHTDMERAQRQPAPFRPALPDHAFTGGQRFRQPERRAHSSGSWRAGVA